MTKGLFGDCYYQKTTNRRVLFFFKKWLVPKAQNVSATPDPRVKKRGVLKTGEGGQCFFLFFFSQTEGG